MTLLGDNVKKYSRLRTIKRIKELREEFALENNIPLKDLPDIKFNLTDGMDGLFFDIKETGSFSKFEEQISKFTGEFKHESGEVKGEKKGSVQLYANEFYTIWTHIAGNVSNLTFCVKDGFTEHSLQTAFICYKMGNEEDTHDTCR